MQNERGAEESVFLLRECEVTKNEVRIEEFMGEEEGRAWS